MVDGAILPDVILYGIEYIEMDINGHPFVRLRKDINMKVTKKDFTLFKKECQKWINYFGLKNWEIRYIHEGNSHEDGLAGTTIDLDNKLAVIELCQEMNDYDYKNHSFNALAFHEVCEVLIGRLRYLAQSRYASKEEIIEANHEIVRTLENTILKGIKL